MKNLKKMSEIQRNLYEAPSNFGTMPVKWLGRILTENARQFDEIVESPTVYRSLRLLSALLKKGFPAFTSH